MSKNEKVILYSEPTQTKLDQIEHDFKYLKTRFENWTELRETDLMVYENIKHHVYESMEMIDLMKRFLKREYGFNPRKELVLKRDQ
tara:strand:+ start:1132 stop:1389 length:258 start_codon:yes stop_codon:yes gene_type:complete